MRLRFEAIDPSSMRPVRDITALIDADSDGYIERSTANELIDSGQLGYAGMATWLASLIRIFAYDDDMPQLCLGTFFATPTECQRLGRLIKGKIQLDSPLLALSSTLLPSLYVAASGASSATVIEDMCRMSGRATKLTPSAGASRYADPVFYEPGVSCLEVAQEAAARSGLVLGSDRFGFITTVPARPDAGSMQTWTTSPSLTDIISDISKTSSWYTSPTRVIATYTDTDTTIAAAASIPSSDRDAQTRGRHIDATVNVTDITVPSPSVLRGEAQKALDQMGIDFEWKFDAEFRDCDAGVPCRVTDTLAGETLTGIVSDIRVSLTPLMPVSVTLRGSVV